MGSSHAVRSIEIGEVILILFREVGTILMVRDEGRVAQGERQRKEGRKVCGLMSVVVGQRRNA